MEGDIDDLPRLPASLESAAAHNQNARPLEPLRYAPSVSRAVEATPAPSGGGWTISLLCFGLGIIAACVIIPQTDANRRLVYEREKLRLDLDQINKQTAVYDSFLAKIDSDPQLVERLARRQMRQIRQGESELQYKPHTTAVPASPFMLVNVPPPPPLAPYKPVGGLLANWCRDTHSKLYLLGGGMMLVAAGLVMGTNKTEC